MEKITLVKMLMHHAAFSPPTNKIKSVPLCFNNWYPESKHLCCFVVFCFALMALVFKIQVISQQTISEMDDHIILSALITCTIVK